MIPPLLAPILLCVIVIVSIVLMLIRPRNTPEAYWITGGVVVLLALRLISLKLVVAGIAKSLDVCFFLIGMMLLCEVAREHGVFDWLSASAVHHAGGSCMRLFTLIYAVGTAVTVFMSNDATAVVLTPAILAAVRKAKVQPLPYLFACAFVANAASFLLPISNPANLVVFHNAMPPLGKWLLAFGVPCLLSTVVTFFVMRRFFWRELRGTIDHKVDDRPLNANGKMVLAGVGLMVAILLIASSLEKNLGLPACLAALGIAAVVCIKERANPLVLAREISWTTLVLVAGLFIMVDAVESIGAMKYTRECLAWAQHLGLFGGEMVTGFALGIANNLVNNLPLGLIAGSTLRVARASGPLTQAVLIGVDVGPNLSITGSLATILWLIALRKEDVNVTFWQFLELGAITMPVALFASLLSGILMNLCFPAL